MSSKLDRKLHKPETTGWDTAIKDAKRHIERLHGVIEVCEEKKASGEPWPGDKKAGTASESIPA